MWRGPICSGGARQKLIILARSYNYQTAAYYCALLGEARGHRVMPSVETMLDLRGRAHYEHALPELEETFNRDMQKVQGDPPMSLFVAFGLCETPGLRAVLAASLRLVPRPDPHRDVQAERLACHPEDRADAAVARIADADGILRRRR